MIKYYYVIFTSTYSLRSLKALIISSIENRKISAFFLQMAMVFLKEKKRLIVN